MLDAMPALPRLKSAPQRDFMGWLKAIDNSLQDVRGFAPTIKLKFKFPDRSFTYSRDWVTKYLRPPDHYDVAEDTYVYHDALEHCLREQAQPLECRFFYPKGTTELISTWTVPHPALWQRYRQKYLNPREYPSKPEIKQFYERAALFIELTRLMPRADKTEGELIESDII